MLASGGNDNKLYVWDVGMMSSSSGTVVEPLCKFDDHTAAVKAVAWSPHQHGLLASGGGTADRHIRFWSAASGVALHKVDTGSQVSFSLCLSIESLACLLMHFSQYNSLLSCFGRYVI
jgi:cell division cycle 20-like protein 1 (cofactor of APC complex)